MTHTKQEIARNVVIFHTHYNFFSRLQQFLLENPLQFCAHCVKGLEQDLVTSQFGPSEDRVERDYWLLTSSLPAQLVTKVWTGFSFCFTTTAKFGSNWISAAYQSFQIFWVTPNQYWCSCRSMMHMSHQNFRPLRPLNTDCYCSKQQLKIMLRKIQLSWAFYWTNLH